MKGYAITVLDSHQSVSSRRVLMASHERVGNEFELATYEAITPATVHREFDRHGIQWRYPWDGTRQVHGLNLHAYVTANPAARMACFMSHYLLWTLAIEGPILILEDDAVFLRQFDPGPLLDSPFDIIGINDPRGATRKSGLFHSRVQDQDDQVCAVPWVDKPEVPQGLAGASAYLMTPQGAQSALEAASTYGAWPNDALLCRQLVDGLGVTKTYYTTIQQTPSTLA